MDKTDQALSNSIQLFNDFAEKGIEFVQQQSPDLCQEIITRACFQEMFFAVCWFVIPLIIYRFLNTAVKRYEYNDDYDKDICLMLRVFSKISLIPMLVLAPIGIYSFISICIAPKLYLVEYFTRLIK